MTTVFTAHLVYQLMVKVRHLQLMKTAYSLRERGKGEMLATLH